MIVAASAASFPQTSQDLRLTKLLPRPRDLPSEEACAFPSSYREFRFAIRASITRSTLKIQRWKPRVKGFEGQNRPFPNIGAQVDSHAHQMRLVPAVMCSRLLLRFGSAPLWSASKLRTCA